MLSYIINVSIEHIIIFSDIFHLTKKTLTLKQMYSYLFKTHGSVTD